MQINLFTETVNIIPFLSVFCEHYTGAKFWVACDELMAAQGAFARLVELQTA